MAEHKYHHNVQFYNKAGVGNIPARTGDRWWAQDKVRDFRILQGMVGRFLWELLGESTGLVRQGAITASGYSALNVAAHAGVVEFDIETADDDTTWQIPPAKVAKQIYVMVENPSLTDFSLSGATLNGSTPNYLKLSYAEQNINTRARHFAAGSYYYVLAKSYVLTCTLAAPTAKEVLLSTVIGDGSTFLTITPAESILPSLKNPTIQASADAVMLSRRRYFALDGCKVLTLPRNPAVGDEIEVVADQTVLLAQSQVGESIEYLKAFYTTKGPAVLPPASAPTGYVQLLPGRSLKAVYKGLGLSRIEPGVKLTNPGTLPAGTGYGCSFSPDGTFLAVAHALTPFITIYKRSGDTFTKLTNPGTLPASTANGCSFSPDGTFLAVAHTTTPSITIYKNRESVTKQWLVTKYESQFPAGGWDGMNGELQNAFK